MKNIAKAMMVVAAACLLAQFASSQEESSEAKKEAVSKPAAEAQAAPKESAPATELSEDEKKPPEVVLFDKTGKMAPVKFFHAAHLKKNACKDCHEGKKPLFAQKRSEAVLKMADMYAGKTCGACHNGKKAFAAKAQCMKCHRK